MIQLTAKALGHGFGQGLLFDQISFHLQPGQLLHIRGSNGSGKTTLLRIAAGLIKPSQGQVTLAPQQFYIGHQLGLKPQLTVWENLRFDWRLPKLNRSQVLDVLARLKIAPWCDQPIMYLSAGQQKRIIWAKLLLAKTPVWLLDEPLSHLDVPGMDIAKTILAEHVNKQGIVLLTSHRQLQLPECDLQTLQLGAA